jgi:Leucine-rich repeat (LRR) protein
MPTFPGELSNFFPNLRFIEIYDCKMKKIFADDLKGLTKLEKLKLDYNEISYLPGNLFEFTPKISHVSFVNNRITKIGPHIFDNVKNLMKADFSRNLKINYRYSKSRQDLHVLKNLIIEHCQPVDKLMTLTMEIVMRNLTEENIDDISMIAKHLGLDTLSRSAELFYELD